MQVQISDDAKGVLAAVSTLGPAIIAGGYLRDLVHGKEFKDIDIFVETPNGVSRSQVEKAVGRVGKKECQYGAIKRKYIQAVYTLPKFDIICVSVPVADVLDDFDFGINQIWYDGFKVHMSRDFVSSHLSRDIYPLKTGDKCIDPWRVQERGERIAEKLGFTYRGVERRRGRFGGGVVGVAAFDWGFDDFDAPAPIPAPQPVQNMQQNAIVFNDWYGNAIRNAHAAQQVVYDAVAVNPAAEVMAEYNAEDPWRVAINRVRERQEQARQAWNAQQRRGARYYNNG